MDKCIKNKWFCQTLFIQWTFFVPARCLLCCLIKAFQSCNLMTFQNAVQAMHAAMVLALILCNILFCLRWYRCFSNSFATILVFLIWCRHKRVDSTRLHFVCLFLLVVFRGGYWSFLWKPREDHPFSQCSIGLCSDFPKCYM